MEKKITLRWLVFSLLFLVFLGSSNAVAFELGPFDASFYLLNQTYIRPWHGPDDIMQCRNEFNLELVYSKIPHTTFFINLRPFYDAVYDMEDEGTGGNARFLRSGWAHNLVRNDDRDPFLRECYLDYHIKSTDVRLGRQIVAWGKSDGVYMLDIVNPFNFRNPSEFKEELTRIPLWMLNINQGICDYGTLQLLWIFDKYRSNMFPGFRISEDGYHDWTFNTVALSNELYMIFDDFFKNVLGIPEGYPVVFREPAHNVKNSKLGVRWSGLWQGISYTLNYFNTWSDPFDWPNTGLAATSYAIKRRADRISVFGFSLDKYVEEPINGVIRLETAYTKGMPFYLPDTNLQERDQIGYMLGYDRWVHKDWLLSFQLWQNFILDPVHHKNAYVGFGATEFDWNTMTVANGLIDPIVSNLTAYLSHDGFFMGDTGHVEFFFLNNLNEGYKWFWTKFRYELTDQINLAIGMNFFWGNEDDLLGQFHDNDNIFFEIKYGFI